MADINSDLMNFFLENQDFPDLTLLVNRTTAILDNYQNVYVKIAIIGLSGQGKSTFINTIRGLEDNVDNESDPNIAKTTPEKQNLNDPKSYTFPDSPHIVLTDLVICFCFNF